jgi:hypothetical protein
MPASIVSGLATPGRALAILAALAAAALAALALALVIGSVPVDGAAILGALTGATSDTNAAIVRELRLPRALAAFAVGGLLALAGALMQVLLRNPLADPYVLGISGGAAVGALGAMLAGAAALVTAAALGGALLSTLIVFMLARAGAERAPWTSTRLLLTGVVVAAGWGALIALMLTLAPDAQVKGMLFWLIGDLGGATVPRPRSSPSPSPSLARWRSRAISMSSPAARTSPRRSVSPSGARPSCSVRWPRSQPPPRSRPPAASASSVSSSRMRCGLSSATTSACWCPRARLPAARCWCSRTRWRAASSPPSSCPSA